MKTISTYETATLKVPGASLYYEVRGAGPVLLMMPGGPADATTFRKIEDRLATKYKVVTYDPRNLSHSTLDAPIDDASMVETFADDVHRLLKHLGDEKACIFASSGGAVIAMELIKKHPEQVNVVVLHEPPAPDFLADTAGARAAFGHVCDTCASQGVWAAASEFMNLIGIHGGPPPAGEGGEPTPEQLEAMGMMHHNMEFFFGRYIRNIANYGVDVEALKACPCKVVAAVGADSTGQLAHDGGVGLAKRLGVEPTVFPGDHGGFDGRPEEFAARLLQVLGEGPSV
ncbi:MAG TPA: alpha/beta hydrolase [Candidatus Dormibacteraeota bacterium]|nr:alpha/beta hydrolase [Candidatus Dormibacteraeota bacterium]